jgi:hypothetical protein
MGDGRTVPVFWTRIRDRVRRKYDSIRTEQAYVHLIQGFVWRHNKSGRLDGGWQISVGMAVGSDSASPHLGVRPVRR